MLHSVSTDPTFLLKRTRNARIVNITDTLLRRIITTAGPSTLNQPDIDPEDIMTNLYFITKMQIQPENIWQSEENLKITRFHLLSSVLGKLGKRSITGNQYVGHPLQSLFNRGIYLLQAEIYKNRLKDLIDEIRINPGV